jgi:uridine kinase
MIDRILIVSLLRRRTRHAMDLIPSPHPIAPSVFGLRTELSVILGFAYSDLATMQPSDITQTTSGPGPKVVVVGFAGGTGSGKSTLVEALAPTLGCPIVRISLDDYYLPQDSKTIEDRQKTNYDAPSAFDWPLFRLHLGALKHGKTVEDAPSYDFSLHTRKPEHRRLGPGAVILVDGILLFTDEEVRGLIDLRVFVDTSPDIRLLRRLTRDFVERGREFLPSVDQYFNTVRPMHLRYVECSKQYAHLVVNNDLDERAGSRIGLDVLISGLAEVTKRMLSGQSGLPG